MSLSDEKRHFYEQTLDVTRQEIADLDRQIEAELAKVKETLKDLQKAKKAAFQMYDAACLRLGIPNDLEGMEGESPQE